MPIFLWIIYPVAVWSGFLSSMSQAQPRFVMNKGRERLRGE